MVAVKPITNTEMVRLILTLPEYRGRALFNLSEIARIYFRGNDQRARAFISDKSIPHYLEPYGAKGGRGRKMYNIYEVQEAVSGTRWEDTA